MSRRDIHFHAVDDGEEILLPQTEGHDRHCQRLGKAGRAASGIQAGDIGAPAIEHGKARGLRPFVVGDIVDGAAEGVDRIHRLDAGRAEECAWRDRTSSAWRPVHVLCRC